MKNMYFYEVKLSEDGEFVHSEGIGNLAAVSSIGEDVHDAFDKVYNVVDTVKVPDLQYRTDMGEVLNGSFQKFMPFDT